MSHRNSNPVEWIVCERTSRWISALRMMLASGDRAFRLRELRHTAELDGELLDRPGAIVAVEIRRDNFAQVVAWLASARKCHVRARTIALVDHSIDSHVDQVWDVLVEAGAEAIATSPRQLAGVIAIAERHAEIAEKTEENASLLGATRTSLPWQVE